jgi:predicted permease
MRRPKWLRWRSDAEFEEELQAHLDMEIQANIERGMSAGEARYAAMRTLGNRTRIQENAREGNPMSWVESVAGDARYAWRNLRRSPGFTLAAVFSLALGIGANSAIFSFLDAVLLRPLDVPRAGELVKIRTSTPQSPFGGMMYREYIAYRDGNHTLTGLAAQARTWLAVKAPGEDLGRLTFGLMVDGAFFRTLEISTSLGRPLSAADDLPGTAIVAVLSHAAWSKRFSADTAVVGSAITLNGQPATIVGVLPQEFLGTDVNERPEIYVSLAAADRLFPLDPPLNDPAHRPDLVLLGRLRPGLSVEAAQKDFAAIAAALAADYPETNRERTAAVLGEIAARFALSPAYTALVVLLGSLVATVLLIACTNVVNLLLGRASARSRELAIRAALGAGRKRLIAQLLTESALLSGLGGGAGLILATWVIRFFASIEIPADTPMQVTTRLDDRVLLYTLGVMVAATFVFGLWPAVQATRADLTQPVKGATPQRVRYWGRHMLVGAQTTLAAVLLVVAGLYLQSFAFISGASPGFRVENVMLAAFDPVSVAYPPAQTRQFYREIQNRARSLPGVRSAALANFVPLDVTEGYALAARAEDDANDSHSYTNILFNIVTPEFFDTLDMPVLRGRSFDGRDTEGSPPVAVINEAMARFYWPDNDAIGRRFRIGGSAGNSAGNVVEVVGVARDANYEQLQEAPRPYYFLPFAQRFASRMTLMLETAGDPAAIAPLLRAEVRALDNDLTLEVRTMRDLVEGYAMLSQRMITQLVGAMAVTGLSLGVLGLYAVIAFLVSRRSREIGIRMALGASRQSVLRGVLLTGLKVTATGMGVGLALAWLITPGFGSNLPGVSHHDPATFIGVAALIAFVAVAACWIPARRAASVDPAITLREQ